jgi:nucleoside-triphosphatase THEP1
MKNPVRPVVLSDKPKKYKIVLSKKGEAIFKGGNVEILKKPLRNFTAKSIREAEKKYNLIISEEVGSASFDYFRLEEVK